MSLPFYITSWQRLKAYFKPGRLGTSITLLAILLFNSMVLANPFPSVETYQLNTKKVVIIPAQLASAKTFIAIGFDPKQQAILEKAMVQAEALKKTYPELDVIEIPVIESKYKPLRNSIDPFMKKAVKTPLFQDRVYPLFTDMAAFKTKLGLSRQQEYAFLLINRQGQIIWKSTASPTNANFLKPIVPLIASE